MCKRWFVCSFGALLAACGSSGNGGGSDATTEGASSDAAEDVASSDAADDGSASCPGKQPRDGDPCSGSGRCQYGHTVCCGITYSQFTCVCQQGSYFCAMTVECNFVCSDGGDAGGG
jgi:hypothetical protein